MRPRRIGCNATATPATPPVNILLGSIKKETVDRGVTILDGSGGYTQAPKPVLMCVIKQKQYPLLESSVLEIDPKAFIIVNDVHQVHGAGFTSKHVVETNETTY